MALPDFLVIGAMKCGTTTLAAQLAAQPGIFMTTPKEPEFFSDDVNFHKGRHWYESLFAAAAPDALKGEASTGYTKLPTYPEALERIATLLPSVRLIYLIRNPLDRLVSHYIHEWTMGVISCDLATALSRHPELIEYGRYARQIQPYLEAFGPERILLLTMEGMRSRPQDTLTHATTFLGHPHAPRWREDRDRVNASDERYRRFPLHRVLIDSFPARTLRRALVPKSLRERIRRGRQMQERPRLTAADRTCLQEIYAEDGVLLANLFPGRDDIAQCYRFGAT